MKIIKTCPYCTCKLPFFNLLRQQLTLAENKALVCPHCSSTISTIGHASIWVSLGLGSSSGFLLGKLLGGLTLKSVLLAGGSSAVIFFILLYITAPVRDA